MFLSEGASKVLLVVQGRQAAKSMSDYLSTTRVKHARTSKSFSRTRNPGGCQGASPHSQEVELENTGTGERQTVKTAAVSPLVGATLRRMASV